MQGTTESHCKTGSDRGGGDSHCTAHTSYQCRNANFCQFRNNSAAAPRAGLHKIDVPVVACSFDVYLEMAIVQMMYTHATLLCPPPQ